MNKNKKPSANGLMSKRRLSKLALWKYVRMYFSPTDFSDLMPFREDSYIYRARHKAEAALARLLLSCCRS